MNCPICNSKLKPYRHNSHLTECPVTNTSRQFIGVSHFYNYGDGSAYVAINEAIKLVITSFKTFVLVADNQGFYELFHELDRPKISLNQINETFNHINRILNLKAFL